MLRTSIRKGFEDLCLPSNVESSVVQLLLRFGRWVQASVEDHATASFDVVGLIKLLLSVLSLTYAALLVRHDRYFGTAAAPYLPFVLVAPCAVYVGARAGTQAERDYVIASAPVVLGIAHFVVLFC